MTLRKIDRRSFLRGVGGAAVALPLLELMREGERVSYASDPPPAVVPLRYLVCFSGVSMGAEEDPKHNDYVPDVVGPNYDLKSATQPFADHGVQKEITIVSGLRIPTAAENAGKVPAGGRRTTFHCSMLSPMLSGVRSSNEDNSKVFGASSDQIVADAIGQGTVFKSLAYRVQAAFYQAFAAPYGRDVMSHRKNGAADAVPIQPIVSPRAAFDALFYNFSPAEQQGGASSTDDLEHRSRKSVLDLVKSNTERLVTRLGGADRRRIERHLDEIRDLEKQIETLPPPATGACAVPADPGADPALGGDITVNGSDINYNTNLGYSGEKERARVFCDLVRMAFACDLTRAGSLMITMGQSHLNMKQITGQISGLHDLTHNWIPGGTMSVSKAIAWHMDSYAYLVSKLKDTPEGEGTLLDSCAVVMLHEGGHGLDPSSGKQLSAHSTENMVCSIAGGAGKLKRGHHVVATGKHPANVLVTAMRAVGVETDALGEVTGHLPSLLTA